MPTIGEDPDRRRRRILVTNHHLQVRAGSELVALEVADALRNRGNDVALFTFHLGELAADFSALSGIEVLDPGRIREVREFDPDVIHAHHWPTLAYLRRLGVEAPAVMGFLGVLPALENPPPLPIGAEVPWWAVSEEVAANVRAVGGWNKSPSHLIRNWYDDKSGLPTARARRHGFQRLLVVSNHFPTELLASLTHAAGMQGASVEHVGLPENPRLIDDELLRSFDAVVTLGRTAIACLANGIPVLVLDEGGGDGWVTAASVAQLARCNFSGRARTLAPSTAQLMSWLENPPTEEDLSHLREWVQKEALLSTSVNKLEELYQAAIAQSEMNGLGRWSCVVADYVLERQAMSSEGTRLGSEVAAAQAEQQQLSAELAASREEMSHILGQFTASRGELEASHAELASSRAELAALADLRDELLDSVSWRITTPLRASKRLMVGGKQRASLKAAKGRETTRKRAYSSPNLWLHSTAAASYFREVEAGFRPFQVARTREPATRQSTAIPSRAWLGVLEGDRWEFTLGDGVERAGAGFFEGVWTGGFDQFRPEQSEFAFGSGAVWHEGGVLFVPPKHPEEALFVLHDATAGRSYASNSLAFVLRAGRVTTTSDFFSCLTEVLHDHTFEDGKRGVDRTRPLILSTAGLTLHRLVHHNFEVGREGTIRRHWMRPRRAFTTFSEYQDFLETRLRELVANGSAPGRRRSLEAITSVSRGYDSTAVSALAARAGCSQAVTLAAAVFGRDDSGTEIGSQLGHHVTEHLHPLGASIDQLDFDQMPEELAHNSLEFIATPGIGDDVAFLPFEDRLKDKILFSGAFGDSIWAREADVGSGLPVRVLFGKSITEFRLRTSFAYVPVPFIAARFAPPIKAISKSPEMEPFKLGTGYDRPIPRRIAEEAGVSREAFGLAKTAAAPWLKDHRQHFPYAIEHISRRYETWADV